VTGQAHEDNGIDAEAVLEQGLMFAIECGEVEGLTMPVRIRTFEDAGIRTPRHGLVVKDAEGREFWLSIVRSGEAAATPERKPSSGAVSQYLQRFPFHICGARDTFASSTVSTGLDLTDELVRGIHGVGRAGNIMPALVGALLPQAADLVRALARSGSAGSSSVGGSRMERDRPSPDG
jgi:hypothetical protein